MSYDVSREKALIVFTDQTPVRFFNASQSSAVKTLPGRVGGGDLNRPADAHACVVIVLLASSTHKATKLSLYQHTQS